jgi:predicted GNAT family N-acyltransferase
MNASPRDGVRLEFFDGTDDPRFNQTAKVRRLVFIEEQSVPENEEWDGIDPIATHILAVADDGPAGTLRCHPDGRWWHVGRVAVVPRHRGKGVAQRMLGAALDLARTSGFARSSLNAQSDKMGLYAKFGYTAVGGEFLDANIPHFRMEAYF